MDDTERLDWLEKITESGSCPGLVFDDDGHWAVAFDGMQSLSHVGQEDGGDVSTSFFIPRAAWKNTIREAIDTARTRAEADDQG